MAFRTRIVEASTGGGPVPPAPGALLQNINTSGLVSPTDSGKALYIDSNNHAALADAATLATAAVKGIWFGFAGQAAVQGPVPQAQFTTVGGMPAAGADVFLALASSEAGAAGKLTATPPTGAGEVVVKMGRCEDNTNYAGIKACKILIQIQIMQVNPSP